MLLNGLVVLVCLSSLPPPENETHKNNLNLYPRVFEIAQPIMFVVVGRRKKKYRDPIQQMFLF